MEELVGPDVQVVLALKHGIDFKFLNSPCLAVATLNSNQMETDLCDLETDIKFNTELIWETTKNNIRKMRNNNVPIRVEFYKVVNKFQREKFGYIVLSLKTAQYLPKNKIVTIHDDWQKVVGTGKEAKGCTPQVLMSLRIQDKITEINLEPPKFVNLNNHNIETEASDVPEHDLHGVSVAHNVEPTQEAESTFTKTPTPRSPRFRTTMPSALPPTHNWFNCSQHGDFTKKAEAYHLIKLIIYLRDITWYKIPPKFQFRFQHTRCEISSTAHPEISIDKPNEAIQLYDIKAELNFSETPSNFQKVIVDIPPVINISCVLKNRPAAIAKCMVDVSALLNANGSPISSQINVLDVNTHEVVGILSTILKLVDCGAQTMNDVSLKLKPIQEAEVPPLIEGNITDRIVDELEDWKERQKTLFQQEFANRLQKQMEEMQADWTKRRTELEEAMNNRMDQCHKLGQSLLEATEEVRLKTLKLEERERQLDRDRSLVECKYKDLFKELQEEHEKLVKDCDDRISQSENERRQSEMENQALKEQLAILEEVKKTNDAELDRYKKASLSSEQTATLLQDLRNMQLKVESLNNSKLFYKEQWGRAAREIHRLKSEYSKNEKEQLLSKKEELKSLGLEQLFLAEKHNLERDDLLEAKDFLGNDLEVVGGVSERKFIYNGNFESYKTNMDIIKEQSKSLLKCTKENEEKIVRLYEERDKILELNGGNVCDDNIAPLNREIRSLLGLDQ